MNPRQFPKLFTALFLIGIGIFFTLNCSEKENLAVKHRINISIINIGDTSSNVAHSVAASNKQSNSERTELLFIGSYGTSAAILIYKLDTVTGGLSSVSSSPGTSNPSYLTIHSNKKWLYAVNENNSGTISAFTFDTVNNNITFLNSKSSQGSSPCFVSIDNSGKFVLMANYNNGSVAICPINPDGSLGDASATDQHAGSGPVAGRQDGPHAHMIIQASNNYIYNTDLGSDKIFIYSLDTTNGHITSTGYNASAVAGDGPRHIAFHPSQPWAYVVCELKGKIEAFDINNSTSALSRFQIISTLADTTKTDAASADIHITPDGRYLYASNRGSYNNIAMYSINQGTGVLTFIGNQSAGGTTPRNFVIDPGGKFLLVACQGSNKIITFRINSADGTLGPTGNQLTVTSPVCLKFLEVYTEKSNTGLHTIHF
jgi:6-phosphogluconolactonase